MDNEKLARVNELGLKRAEARLRDIHGALLLSCTRGCLHELEELGAVVTGAGDSCVAVRFYKAPGRLLVTPYMADLKRFRAEYVFMPDADFWVERDGTMVGGMSNVELWAEEMKHWLGIRGSVRGGGLEEVEWQRRPLTYSEQTSAA